jgi:pyruvate-formate lyase-activating enzyme
MQLEEIGFYTLSDHRAANAAVDSRLMRAELLLTARCNFRCPYCRGVGGKDLSLDAALEVIGYWTAQKLFALRLSGGEPLLYKGLVDLVVAAREGGVERIAISSNGSFPLKNYLALIEAGVNDLSISLDACCAEDGNKMAGGVKGSWARVVENIRELSRHTYVTVGVVLTEDNQAKINEIIEFAAELGVADIRVIPAAQKGQRLSPVEVDSAILARLPILRYRLDNLNQGLTVRGLSVTDADHCGLVLDDMAVCEGRHYPCIIYLREGGDAIGPVGPEMRAQRALWSAIHNPKEDPICASNCLDVCVAYNNRFRDFHRTLKSLDITLPEGASS